MSTIFTDGFESGDFSAWTTTGVTAPDVLEVTQAAAFHGTYGVRATAAAGVTRAEKSLGAEYGELFCRFYFEIVSCLPAANDNVAELSRITFNPSGGSSVFRTYVHYTEDAYHLRLGHWTAPSAWTYTTTSMVLIPGRRYCGEMHYRKNSGAADGITRFWLDGELQLDVTGHEQTRTIRYVALWADPGGFDSLEVHYDDVAVDDATRVYPLRGFRVYHNDGLGPIDYDTVRATKSEYDPAWTSDALDYPGTHRFGVRAYNEYGEERNVDVVEEAILLASGEESPARPNRPTGLKATAAADGKVELAFSYNAANEEAECTHFHVYCDAGSGEVDYTTPIGSIDKLEHVLSHYAFLSSALTDGQTYLFAVRAATTEDVEDDGIEFVAVAADAQAPDQPVSLTAHIVR